MCPGEILTAGASLHTDNHDAAFGFSIALLVVRIPEVAFLGPFPVRHGKLKLRTITAAECNRVLAQRPFDKLTAACVGPMASL